jgi:hypothetical protein
VGCKSRLLKRHLSTHTSMMDGSNI